MRRWAWVAAPLLALFAACGSGDEPSGTGGAAGTSAGASGKGGAAGAGRAGKGGDHAGGTDAGAAGSEAASGGSSGNGEGADGGTGGANGGRGGTRASGGTDPGGSGAGGEEPVDAPVATIAIDASDFALALGAEATLGAEARDAGGNLVTAEIAWRSSDPGVASVADGVVTGAALGSAQITASAGGVTSAPVVVWVNPVQTTAQAIRAAVAAGTLSDDEALVYRVFALFRDSRLPGEYWSTLPQDRHAGHQLMFEVAERFDSLSAAHQNAVAPFLVPPAYAPLGSLVTWGSPPNQLAAWRPVPCSGVFNPGWESVDSAHFRVWFSPQIDEDIDRAWAEMVSGHAEAAYQELVTTRGFRAPVPDSGICNGGDARIDIYLPNTPLGAAGLTTPVDESGGTSSAYIQISPTVSVGEMRGTIAHEFMHVLQAAYPNLYTPSYRWTRDGTATWAESLLVPGSSSYLPYADEFLTRVHEPLFFPNQYCDANLRGSDCGGDASADFKLYGGYLFFQFIEHRAGAGTVKNFFENAAGDPESLNQLSFVLSGQGGLQGIWGEFARTLWNRDPIPAGSSFRGWDNQTASLASRTGLDEIQRLSPMGGISAVPRVPSILLTNGSRVRTAPLNELSASYDHYEFAPDVRSVTFYNGFSLKMGKTPFGVNSSSGKSLDAGEMFIVYETTEEEIKGREVWALKKIDGMWTAEDWSATPFGVHCLDKQAERVQELVLIYSNGNYTTARSDSFTANAIGPLGAERGAVVASSSPCWKLKGNASAMLDYNNAGDVFSVSTTYDGSFVGERALGRASNATGLGYVFLGYRFTTDLADAYMSSSFVGTFDSCGGAQNGLDEYNGSELAPGYDFSTFLTIPDGTNQNKYSGRSGSFQWLLQGCAGGDKRLPAPAIIDFDLNFERLQSIDTTGGETVLHGTDLPGPVTDQGAYTNVPDVRNHWCFKALREGEPAPPACN